MDIVRDNSPDLADEDIYVNVTVTNNTQGTIEATYQTTSNEPILGNPSDYKGTIARLDLPSTDIEKFTFEANTYSISLEYPTNSFTSRQFLVLDDVVLVPNPIHIDDNAIYFIKQMVKSINDAFVAAYAAIVADNGGPLPIGHPQGPPMVVYNSPLNVIEVYAPIEYDDFTSTGTANPNKINIYATTNLGFMFQNIYSEFIGLNSPSGEDFRIKVTDEINNSGSFSYPLRYTTLPVVLPGGAIDSYVLRQEYGTINLWYDTYKIVLTTDMNVRREYIIDSGSEGDLEYLPILTDFNYEFTRNHYERLSYAANPFRWFDLLQTTPLKKISFRILLQTRDGRLFPLQILPGESFNIKMLFRKK